MNIAIVSQLEGINNQFVGLFQSDVDHHSGKIQVIKADQKRPEHILISVFTFGIFAIVKAFVRLHHELSLKSAENKLNSCKSILTASAKEKAVFSNFLNGKFSEMGEEGANIAREALNKAMPACYALPKVAKLTEKFSGKQLKLIEDFTASVRSIPLSKSDVDLQTNFVKMGKALELLAPVLQKFLN